MTIFQNSKLRAIKYPNFIKVLFQRNLLSSISLTKIRVLCYIFPLNSHFSFPLLPLFKIGWCIFCKISMLSKLILPFYQRLLCFLLSPFPALIYRVDGEGASVFSSWLFLKEGTLVAPFFGPEASVAGLVGPLDTPLCNLVLSGWAGSEPLTGAAVTILDDCGASGTLIRPVFTRGCARGCGQVTLSSPRWTPCHLWVLRVSQILKKLWKKKQQYENVRTLLLTKRYAFKCIRRTILEIYIRIKSY